MAMTARTICGLLSGNIGVLRSMVGEITDETNQARAISLLPFVYGLGSLLGSILGGFLSQPAKQYPSIFGECEFLKTYPYFLPCAITAIICLIGFIIGYFYLEETLPSKIAKNQSVEYEATESESLLQNKSHKSYQSASIEDVSVVAVSGDKKSGLQALFTKQILLVVSTFMFIALQQVMDSELFPLWVVTSVDHGGLSFGSEQIGIALGYQGLLTLFIQLLWFPWAHNRYGTLNLLRTILHISPLVYFFQGLIRMLVPLGQEFVWLALIVILSFKTLTVVVSMSCSMILINSSTPARHSLGTLNGLSQCMFSLMTTIGPTLCGIIYSWSLRSPLRFPFDEHTAFFVITLVGLITCIISWFIEDPKNIRNK
ncbi:hypothetical protein K7432_013599 [Basidiobolus ranarum]|uniref:Major facilitator superfamily (MFS) profile domain-containing protein n=1 Tax=Basidiobolus ranarum TaxID=34480 RepID=A0ABR2WIZ9_9FUNG